MASQQTMARRLHLALALGASLATACAHTGAPPACARPEARWTRSAAPVAVGLAGVTDVMIARDHLCALLGDGTVRCLGPASADAACPEQAPAVEGARDAVALFDDCARLR